MTTNTPATPRRPAGVDEATFRKAWDSLSEADRQVLLTSAKHGYSPHTPPPVRRKRPAAVKGRS